MSVEDLADAARTLMPPGFNPSKRLKYDLAVSGAILGIGLLSALHVAISCGFLNIIGMSGFALASEVNAQQQTLTAVLLNQINHDIKDSKRQICMAQQAHNELALRAASDELQRAKGEYQAVTKTWPQVQSCDELVVDGGAQN